MRDIAALFQESMELSKRETVEGLKAVEQIALEMQKPKESRDYKSLVDLGEKLLNIASKATDLSVKLAPHLPQITMLIHEAGKHL